MTSKTCLAENPNETLIYQIDYALPLQTAPLPWFEKQGYKIGLDADEFDYQFNQNGLNISTTKKMAGIIGIKFDNSKPFQSVDFSSVEFVDIEWGVERYPVKANWEKKKRKVAIATMFFFGEKKISSGLPFGINSAPYFLSPFIGNMEPVNKVYQGRLYKKGGRYINVANSEQKGQLITTRILLKERFLKLFKIETMPTLSGFAFQMNTKGSKGGAKAFIKSVKFYKIAN